MRQLSIAISDVPLEGVWSLGHLLPEDIVNLDSCDSISKDQSRGTVNALENRESESTNDQDHKPML